MVMPQVQYSEDGQWWWNGSQWQPVQRAALTSVQRSTRGFLLTFDSDTDVASVGTYVWPGGAPGGVTITPLAQTGQFELTHVTLDDMQAMEPSIGNMFAEASRYDPVDVMPAQPPSAAPKFAIQLGMPDLNDPDFQAKMRQWLLDNVEDASTALDLTELGGAVAEVVGSGEALALGMLVEDLNPIGVALNLFVMFAAVYEAFQVADRTAEERGFVHGLGWEVLGMPRRTPRLDPSPLEWLRGETLEELTVPFMDGVDAGMAKAREVKIHNQLALQIAYMIATKHSDALDEANTLMNEIWTRSGRTNPIYLQDPFV